MSLGLSTRGLCRGDAELAIAAEAFAAGERGIFARWDELSSGRGEVEDYE